MRRKFGIMGFPKKPEPEVSYLELKDSPGHPVRIEIYDGHGETTASIIDWLLRDKNDHLSRDMDKYDRAKIEYYYKLLESINNQLLSYQMPQNFTVAYLTRGHLGLTKDELRKRWQNGSGRGVSVLKVMNRLASFNKKYGTKLRPCHPAVPFVLMKLDVHSAPFHYGFVGTGLRDTRGRKLSIHVHAPLDFKHIARSLHSQPVAGEYYHDGDWEPSGAQSFVFEC